MDRRIAPAATWLLVALTSAEAAVPQPRFLGRRDYDAAGREIDSLYAAVADVNGDGIPDIIAGGGGGEMVQVFLGKGDGDTFPQEIGGLENSTLAIGTGGVLYGTQSNEEVGFVYSLTPPAIAGGAWTEETIYNFDLAALAAPQGGVVLGSGGVLYGSTADTNGGPAGDGTIFSLTPPVSPGGAWPEAGLYTFGGGSDGNSPGPLVMDANGVLYGTTLYGGEGGYGTVFSLTPPGVAGGAWTQTTLCNFDINNGWHQVFSRSAPAGYFTG